jgi:hypothetical protein
MALMEWSVGFMELEQLRVLVSHCLLAGHVVVS